MVEVLGYDKGSLLGRVRCIRFLGKVEGTEEVDRSKLVEQIINHPRDREVSAFVMEFSSR